MARQACDITVVGSHAETFIQLKEMGWAELLGLILTQSPAGSADFCKWESCWTMPLVGRFSLGSPISPPLHYGTAPYSLQSPLSALDLAVKSRPNLFTSLHSLNYYVGITT
ncbi:hypothetical protein PR048_013383 [Dryococelus australis]|uniref:Uncharacterized protein n=1 Tax=Dryococelus australis TaxID=614101 RepID=A0ABQ9HTI8_9NEOP|nr:hypothetical protein PR048_013383 [Dryococelus australis]